MTPDDIASTPQADSSALAADVLRLRRSVHLGDVNSLVRALLEVRSGALVNPEAEAGALGGGDALTAGSSLPLSANRSRLERQIKGAFAPRILGHPHPGAFTSELSLQLGGLAEEVDGLRRARVEELRLLDGGAPAGALSVVGRLLRVRSREHVFDLQTDLERLNRRSHLRVVVPALTTAGEVLASVELFVQQVAGQRSAIQAHAGRAAHLVRRQMEERAARLDQVPDDLLPHTPRFLLEALATEDTSTAYAVGVETVAEVLTGDSREEASARPLPDRVAEAMIQRSREAAVVPDDLPSLLGAIHKVRGLPERDALRRAAVHLHQRAEEAPIASVTSEGQRFRFQAVADPVRAILRMEGGQLQPALLAYPRLDVLGLLYISTDHALDDVQSLQAARPALRQAEARMNFRISARRRDDPSSPISAGFQQPSWGPDAPEQGMGSPDGRATPADLEDGSLARS